MTVCCHEQQLSMNRFSFIRAVFYEAKIKPVVIRKSGSLTDVLPPIFSIICVCSLQFCDSWHVAELSVCRIIRLQNTEPTDWFLISGLRGIKMVWLHGWRNLTGSIIPLWQSRTGMLKNTIILPFSGCSCDCFSVTVLSLSKPCVQSWGWIPAQ